MEPHVPQSVGEIAASGKTSFAGAIEPRRLMWALAEVCWSDAAGHSIRSRATIIDISTSGACIRLKDQIGIGSHLIIKWHREQFAATARNCRADGREYLLGVHREALPPDQASAARIQANSPPASTAPSAPAPSASAIEPSDPASRPGAVRESPPRKMDRTESVEKRPQRARYSDRTASVAHLDASAGGRKIMRPKRLFANFWRRQPAAVAPAQLAPKETAVNKPMHAVEQVSDPPARLLSYEDIYHAAGVITPRSGYDIRKVVDMLNSERIRDLSKDIQRASVLMALDAAGASVGELLQDATRRQQALNAYEEGQRQQLQELEARKAQENARIEAEMQRITAHYAERIQQNKDEVVQHKEALHNWQMAKQHENQRITEVMELCGKQMEPAAVARAAPASASGSGAKG